MFGLQNNFVRETLPSDLKLTLQTATEKVRLVELTNPELQPIKADQKLQKKHAVEVDGEQPSKNRDLGLSIPIVNCKYCGKKHPGDKNQ